MARYELLYDAGGKGYLPLDLGGEKPAMNYQINSLNELKDRQATYSQAVKLPKTAHNLRAVGFIDAFDVVALSAYEPQGCRLLCDGALLTPFDALLYIKSVDEQRGGYINCQIVSFTYDLFAQLAEADTEHMNISLWTNNWTSESMRTQNAGADIRWRWPLVFTQGGVYRADAPLRGNRQEVQAYHMVPAYHLNTMLRELFESYHYTLESDLQDDEFANRLYLTASKMRGIGDQNGRIRTVFAQQGIRIPDLYEFPTRYPASSIAPAPNNGTSAGVVVPRENPSLPSRGLRGMRFYAEEPGTYSLRITVRNTGGLSLDANRRVEYKIVAVRRGGIQTQVIDQGRLGIAARGTWSPTFEDQELGLGDYLELQFDIYSDTSSPVISPTYVDFTADIAIEVNEGGEVEPSTADCGVGTPFDYLQSSGFKSYKEFVQSYLQLFGAMVDVQRIPPTGEEYDRRIGKVRIYTFEELYRRRDAGRFVDWSDKLVTDRDRSSGFSVSGYAQRNIVNLTANTDDGTADSATLRVNNRTLEYEKNLFTLPVEAGRNLRYQNLNRTVGVVPTLERKVETDDAGAERVTLEYKGCGPHIVALTGETAPCYDMTGANIFSLIQMSVPICTYKPLGEFFDRYYTRVGQMLNNARTLTVPLMLTPLDIQELDLFTPVYIRHYGAYFYISKISNFLAGQPTKVELVKM